MQSNLKALKEDIRAILVSANNGLSFHQLKKDYYTFTGEVILYERYGFNSLLAFLESLSDVVTIQGYGSHALVYPVITKETENLNSMIQKQRKPPKKKHRFHYKALQMPEDLNEVSQGKFHEWDDHSDATCANTLHTQDSFLSGLETALPALESDDDLFFTGFPRNAARLANQIQQYNIISDAQDAINGLYPIQICRIRTPFQFWFQLKSKEDKFAAMHLEMQEYYEALPDHEFVMHPIDIREKRVCTVKFNGKWCRGEIVDDKPDDEGDFKVFCFDFGKVATVNPGAIKFLMRDFAQMPRQAYRGRISYIKPKGIRWTLKATEKFSSFVGNKYLYAKLDFYKQMDNCHFLTLYDTNSDVDINVGEYLVENRSDVLASTDVKGKESIALAIPTFQMIEQGLLFSQEFAN